MLSLSATCTDPFKTDPFRLPRCYAGSRSALIRMTQCLSQEIWDFSLFVGNSSLKSKKLLVWKPPRGPTLFLLVGLGVVGLRAWFTVLGLQVESTASRQSLCCLHRAFPSATCCLFVHGQGASYTHRPSALAPVPLYHAHKTRHVVDGPVAYGRADVQHTSAGHKCPMSKCPMGLGRAEIAVRSSSCLPQRGVHGTLEDFQQTNCTHRRRVPCNCVAKFSAPCMGEGPKRVWRETCASHYKQKCICIGSANLSIPPSVCLSD